MIDFNVRLGFTTKMVVIFSLIIGHSTAVGSKPPPNIVLILADDLGFSDLAGYGSEIATPNLTALATQGLSFTNYHTGANCTPSRGMLLTGVDSHRAGVPNIPEMIPAAQAEYPHYTGTLGHNVVTVASLLQSSGYHTYLAGKWHLGQTPDKLPSQRGFERTVALGDSGADNWQQKPYLPIYERANWYADGKRFSLPDDFYSSRFLVDKMVEFIGGPPDDGRPFFAYLPLQAVHIPVQAPQIFIDRYTGVYDSGWHELRERRRNNAIALGIVPADSAMVEMASTDNWHALSAERQAYEAKRMAVYAGMIEAMDHHIGRLVRHLKATQQYENTVFIFSSDNGAESLGRAHQDSWVNRRALATQGYSADYKTLGLEGSFNAISPSFASAAVAPLSHYKFYVGEGGMRVPLIIAGERIVMKNQLTDAFAFVTDIAPTIRNLAGLDKTSDYFGGRKVEPMIGHDLTGLLDGTQTRAYSAHEPVGFELAGHGALFLGDYKITLNRGTYGDGEWHLYNIKVDPGETRDLSSAEPLKLHLMLHHYHNYLADNQVLPVPQGYRHEIQMVVNAIHGLLRPNVLIGIILMLVVLPFVIATRQRLQKRPK